MTGHRYTSGSDVASVDVEAYAGSDPSRENGVSRVVFTIIDNVGAQSVITVSARSLRFPNFSPYTNSPLPGAVTPMTPAFAYGITILMSAYPAGVIRVTARAYANNETFVDLPDRITIFNDRDAVDRRPSTKQIYVNSTTGSDSAAGTEGAPVRTIQKAVGLCRKNTAGVTQADADCGGATIFLVDGAHIWGGMSTYDSIQWYTSDDWWLQIVSTSGNATISNLPLGNGTAYPESFLVARGWNNTGSCRIQVSNCKFVNKGGAVYVGNGATNSPVDVHVWIDGGESYTTAPRTGDFTVRFKELTGEIVSIDNGLGKTYATGHTRHHVENGWHGWTMVLDCWIHHFTGISLQDSGNQTLYASNLLIEEQQTYNLGSQTTEGYVWVVDGSKLSVQVSAPYMIVVCNGTPGTLGNSGATGAGFATQFNYLAGSTYMGVGFRRFPSAANNGVFRFVSSGTDGSGNEYVIVENPNAVAQAGVGGGSSSRTEMFTGGITTQLQYNEMVHPDIFQSNGSNSNILCSNIAVRNIQESQGWFFPQGTTQTNCWLVNVSDGGRGIRSPFANSRIVDCGFVHVSISGSWDFTGGLNPSGNTFDDCVINKSSALPFSTSYVRNCHWVDTSSFGADAAGGINPSSGTWYDGDPAVSPHHFTPDVANLDTGSGLYPGAEEFFWPLATTDTRGVHLNVGEYDWQGVNNNALVADPGSFALSGQAATLLNNQVLVSSAGSFALLGKSASFAKTFSLSVGSFILAGQDSAFAKNSPLSVGAGSFVLPDQDSASLLFSQVLAGSAGSFALAGQSASFLGNARVLPADVASFILTGQDASLNNNSQILAAESGRFTLGWQAASLVNNQILAASAGSFVYSEAGEASLQKDSPLATDAGSFILTGQDSALLSTRLLVVDAGSFALAGSDSIILSQRALTADVGSFSLVGQDSYLVQSNYPLVGAVGSFSLTGQDSSIIKNSQLTGEVGSFILAGQPVSLVSVHPLVGDAGIFTLAGQSAAFSNQRVLAANTGIFFLAGQESAVLFNQQLLPADAGSFILTGQDSALLITRSLVAGAGSFLLVGEDNPIIKSYPLDGDVGSFSLAGQDSALVSTRIFGVDVGSFSLSGVDSSIAKGYPLSADTGVFAAVGQDSDSALALVSWEVIESLRFKESIPVGSTRELLNQEIPSAPEPYEDWRIVQVVA